MHNAALSLDPESILGEGKKSTKSPQHHWFGCITERPLPVLSYGVTLEIFNSNEHQTINR